MTKGMLLLSGVLLLLCCDSALACTCVKKGNNPLEEIRKEFRNSRAVFAGELVSIGVPKLVRERNSRGKMYTRGLFVELKFKVSRAWKGVNADTVIVETNDERNSCYVNYKVGTSYLIYAHGKRLYIGYCSRTPQLDHAQEDLQELGEGREFS